MMSHEGMCCGEMCVPNDLDRPLILATNDRGRLEINLLSYFLPGSVKRGDDTDLFGSALGILGRPAGGQV